MMHSMFKSPTVSALYPFFAKYFSLWPLVMLTWWSKGDGWKCCGVGPVQVGKMPALAGELAHRTGRCLEWPRKQRLRDRGGETSWGHMCVSAGVGRAWVIQVTGAVWVGWAYTCVLNISAHVHVCASYGITYMASEMECHTWDASIIVPLLRFLRDPQLNTHPIALQWALCLLVWQYVSIRVQIFFMLETFWLGPLLLTARPIWAL